MTGYSLDAIDLDTRLDQQLLDIAIRKALLQYQRTTRNDHLRRIPEPLNAETGTGADTRDRGIIIPRLSPTSGQRNRAPAR